MKLPQGSCHRIGQKRIVRLVARTRYPARTAIYFAHEVGFINRFAITTNTVSGMIMTPATRVLIMAALAMECKIKRYPISSIWPFLSASERRISVQMEMIVMVRNGISFEL